MILERDFSRPGHSGSPRRGRRPRSSLSGEVGPDAMESSLSPMTSERMREITLAGRGRFGEPARLDAREVLSHRVELHDIGAGPGEASGSVACFSSSETPSEGATRSADPPPEVRQTTSDSPSACYEEVNHPSRSRRHPVRPARDAPPRESRMSFGKRHPPET